MLYLKLPRKIRYFQSHNSCVFISRIAPGLLGCAVWLIDSDRTTYSGYTLYRTRKTADTFRLARKSESMLKSPQHGVILSGYAELKRHDALRDCAKFEVVTEVALKIILFWDVTPCSMVAVFRHFGGTCCLQLLPWRWRQQSPPKLQVYARLHDVTPQSTAIAIVAKLVHPRFGKLKF